MTKATGAALYRVPWRGRVPWWGLLAAVSASLALGGCSADTEESSARVEALVSGCDAPLCEPPGAPSEGEIEALATAQAESLSGRRVALRATYDFLGAGDRPLTRLFLFARRTDAPTTDEVYSRVAAGETTYGRLPWSAWFLCVEMGMAAEAPPVVGFWPGVPLHFAAEAEAQAVVAREYGSRVRPTGRRFRSAWLSVIELEGARGELAYFDAPTQGVARAYREPEWTESERVDRRMRFADSWGIRLDALRARTTGGR